LHPNYPNPFNPATVIPFSIDRPGHVRLDVVDASGRVLRTFADRLFPAGVYRVEWDGTDAAGGSVASGVYTVRLVSGSASRSRKMVLAK
jgi:flagellar hook assembly protein FlgD